MRFPLLAVTAAALIGISSVAHANLITNPDFAPANGGAGYGPVAGWSQVPATSTLSGFPYLTGSNNDTQPFWNNGTAGDATTVGFVQVYPGAAADALSQTLTLVVGQTYYFSYLENSRTTAAPLVTTLVGGNVIVAQHSDPAVGGSNPFVRYTGSFVATGTSEDFTFQVNQANSGDDATALFTHVNVGVTPEPSSIALLGTGLLGLGGIVRRKYGKA